MRTAICRLALLLAASVSLPLSTLALGAQRSFVASTGADSNPCTLALPCRSFTAALATTDANGEVIVLDSAGYGAFTVNQSVSIIAPPGIYAGISVFTTSPAQTGVLVGGGGIKVVLRGLSINGQGGQTGIEFALGSELHIENCVVSNMAGTGISAGGGARIFIKDTIVRGNGDRGIDIFNATEAHLDQVRSERNVNDGLSAFNGPTVSVRNSELVDNGATGLLAQSVAGGILTRVAVESSNISGNGGSGIEASTSGSGSAVEVSATRTTLAGNQTGAAVIASPGSTAHLTAGDNLVTGNTFAGLVAFNAGATLVASGNTVTRNGSAGLAENNSAEVLSRLNNTVSGNNAGGAQTVGLISRLEPL